MNPFDLVKNMQNIQAQMKDMQGRLDSLRAVGSSGAGMVEITVNGKMQVIDLKISAEIVDPSDVKTLEALVAAAFNSAAQQVQQILKEEAATLAGRSI
jgi:DNA-binding YbaB/EbfC family protein